LQILLLCECGRSSKRMGSCKAESPPSANGTGKVGEGQKKETDPAPVHESQDLRADSLISQGHFLHFADVYATMRRNKGKAFVVKIPKTAKPIKVRAFHDLKKLSCVVDDDIHGRGCWGPLQSSGYALSKAIIDPKLSY